MVLVMHWSFRPSSSHPTAFWNPNNPARPSSATLITSASPAVLLLHTQRTKPRQTPATAANIRPMMPNTNRMVLETIQASTAEQDRPTRTQSLPETAMLPQLLIILGDQLPPHRRPAPLTIPLLLCPRRLRRCLLCLRRGHGHHPLCRDHTGNHNRCQYFRRPSVMGPAGHRLPPHHCPRSRTTCNKATRFYSTVRALIL